MHFIRKTNILLFVFFLFSAAAVSAVSLGDLTEKAKKTSDSYRNGKYALSSSAISADITALQDNSSLSLGLKNGTYTFNSDTPFVTTPYVSYSTGGDDPFTIAVSSKLSAEKGSDGTGFGYDPAVTLSKAFSLSGVSSKTSELTIKKINAVQSANEKKYDYQFEKNIINAVTSCVSASSSLESAKVNYDKLAAEYEADRRLGNLTDGSLIYSSRLSALKAAEAAVNSAAVLYENSLASFRSLAGFDYEKIDSSIEGISGFEFSILEKGNTDCLESYYDMLIAVNKAERAANDGYSLGIDASADYAGCTLAGSTKNLDADVSLSLSNALMDISAGGGVKWNTDATAKPYIDFSLSFSPDKSYSIDKAETNQKKVEAEAAKLDYSAALLDYFAEAQKIRSELLNLTSSYQSAKLAFEYASAVYENAKTLAELGYKSESEKKSDEAAFISAEAVYVKAQLELLCTIIDAKLLNL